MFLVLFLHQHRTIQNTGKKCLKHWAQVTAPSPYQNSFYLKGCITQTVVLIGQKTEPGKGPHEGAFLKGSITIFRADPWYPKIYHMQVP